MAQYSYVVLNDGTKWRIKGDAELGYGSGPYRTVIQSNEDEMKPVYNGASSTKTASSGTAKSGTASATVSDTEIKKSAAESKARREAELEAERKEKERKEKIASINASRDEEIRYLGENYSSQRESAQNTMEENMRQLYIAYMQGLMGIPQQTALWGAGGEIESIKNRSRTNYEDNRAKESRSHSGILAQIEQKYQDDLRELEARYLNRLLGV